MSTEIDAAVERILVASDLVSQGFEGLATIVRAELLAAEQRGAAARPAPEPSATGEDQYLCKHGHVHQGKGWAVSCLGDFRPSATALRARELFDANEHETMRGDIWVVAVRDFLREIAKETT